jgi:hypothetical protein
MDNDADWHFGQFMGVPLGARTSKQAKNQSEEKLTLIFSVLVFNH